MKGYNPQDYYPERSWPDDYWPLAIADQALSGSLTFEGELDIALELEEGYDGSLTFVGSIDTLLDLNKALDGELTFVGGLTGGFLIDKAVSGVLMFNGLLIAENSNWGLIVDDLDWQGTYDAGSGYTQGQTVTHTGSKTSSYRATGVVPAGDAPPDSDYWDRVVKGPWRLAGITRNNTFSIEGVDILHGHTYEVAVASRKVTGEEQETESSPRAQIALAGKVSTPTSPTALTATGKFQSIHLAWTAPTEVDWDFIEIWRSNSNNRAAAARIATVRGTAFVDPVGTSNSTRYYWIRGVDTSGNYSAWHPTGSTSGVSGTTTTGAITATDINDFAITASKVFNNIPVIAGDAWVNDSPSAGKIAWNEHTLYYAGNAFTIAAGNTDKKYVYWVYPATSYSSSDTNPTLTDTDFIIATNIAGAHDLAWNAIANEVIGSAYIQNAAIINAKIGLLAVDSANIAALAVTDAKINDLSADKINAGTLTGRVVQTASSGQRVKIDSSDNTLKFYKSGVTDPVIVMDDGLGGSTEPGIYIGGTADGGILVLEDAAPTHIIQLSLLAGGCGIQVTSPDNSAMLTFNKTFDLSETTVIDLVNSTSKFTVGSRGSVNTVGVYKVSGVQVVGPRVVDARIDDTVNTSTWDSTTAGVLDAIRDALITHGLIAAS